MTESTTPDRADLLRRTAASLLFRRTDFDPPSQWPETFSTIDLVKLMVGGEYRHHKADFRRWERAISLGIAAGLETERHETSHTTPPKTVDTWGRITLAGMPARIVATIPGRTTTTICCLIHRKPFATWLKAIGEDPSELVREWLGPEWEDAGAGNTPAAELRKKAAMIDELKSEWPTIERDLQDASRNGLSDMAKARQQHGMWYINKARDWSRQNGKLISAGNVTGLQSSLADKLKAATKTHRIK